MTEAAANRTPLVRSALQTDIPAVADIYSHHVRHGLASFEFEPPDTAEMARRHACVIELGLPYLVAELDGRVVGFAYVAPYRTRPAYRYTVENSVYIHRDFLCSGVGSALLPQLIEACVTAGCCQMLAIIGDSGNESSITLHRKFGFTEVGLLPAVGWKFGRWVDSVLMQRELGSGSGRPPAD